MGCCSWELVDVYRRDSWGITSGNGVVKEALTFIGPHRPVDGILIGRHSEVDRIVVRVGSRRFEVTREAPLVLHIAQPVTVESLWSSSADTAAVLELEFFRGQAPAWLRTMRAPVNRYITGAPAEHAANHTDVWRLPVMGRKRVSVMMQAENAIDSFFRFAAFMWAPPLSSVAGSRQIVEVPSDAVWGLSGAGLWIYPPPDPATGLPVEQELNQSAHVDLVFENNDIAFLVLSARKAVGAAALSVHYWIEARDG